MLEVGWVDSLPEPTRRGSLARNGETTGNCGGLAARERARETILAFPCQCSSLVLYLVRCSNEVNQLCQ